ncbi:ovochymase-2 [Synchiropus splendidus]|uniref:ovochymase-2 n=1 Tax=Synchiropus splendidus TaxID=270530 RepID=UPI00237DB439|nr:ovochymase-2 [Synchiropus splendidus]
MRFYGDVVNVDLGSLCGGRLSGPAPPRDRLTNPQVFSRSTGVRAMRSGCVVLLLLLVPRCVRLHAAAAGPKCGGPEVSRAMLQALRVVGGSEAVRGSHPWLVSLRNRARHFCGGAIVSERWVLTAAHCFTSTLREFLDSVTVAAGEHDQRVLDEEEQIFNIKSVWVHERYRHSAPMSYDVALVELDGHVQFGVLVRPICLPLPEERSAPGSGCIVAGWGRTRERGRLPFVLREVPLELVHRARCQHVLRTVSGSEVAGDMTVLCAGPERGGRDACQGDSGSPLICPTRTGQWEVVGVTSWGKGCGRSWSNNSRRPASRRGSPGVFTDVRLLLPWIKLKLREGTSPGAGPSLLLTPFQRPMFLRGRHLSLWTNIYEQLNSSCSALCACLCVCVCSGLCAVRDGPVTDNKGLIRNPDPPAGRYGNNELCVWRLSVADGLSVLLEFDRLHLENDSLCRHDRLSVLTGLLRPVGETRLLSEKPLVSSCCVRLSKAVDPMILCGPVFPGRVLLNNSQTATLLFSSDVSDAGSGFVVRHLAVQGHAEPAPGCGTVVLLKDQASVQSPNYPQSYRDDCELRWVIHAPAGHIVKLEFVDFDLEESSSCSYDSLTVLADVEAAEEIAVLCGRSLPPDVLSHQDVMVLLFSSDSSVSHRGFRGLISYISLSELHDGSEVEEIGGGERSTRGPGPSHVNLEETAPLVDESGTSSRRAVLPDPVSDDEDDAGESSGHEL